MCDARLRVFCYLLTCSGAFAYMIMIVKNTSFYASTCIMLGEFGQTGIWFMVMGCVKGGNGEGMGGAPKLEGKNTFSENILTLL